MAKPIRKSAEAGRATSVSPPSTKDSLPHVKFKWIDGEKKGTEWLSDATPKGEIAPARIRISGRNSDGSYSYFCYRNARAVAVVRDPKDPKRGLEKAKDACERGPNPKLSDNVLEYVEQHPLDVPFWLRLTEGERRAVRTQYPYAAPSRSAEARGLGRRGRDSAADASDPGTRALLESMARAEGVRPGQPATVRRAKKAALEDREARLGPVPGMTNPGKPGSKRAAGYAIILDGAAKGRTVAEVLAAGANELRLAKCISKGYVELRPSKGGKS